MEGGREAGRERERGNERERERQKEKEKARARAKVRKYRGRGSGGGGERQLKGRFTVSLMKDSRPNELSECLDCM